MASDSNPSDRSDPDRRSDPNDGPQEGYTDHEHVDESAYDQGREVETTDQQGGDGWWDAGLVGTLLVVGLAMFLFPEPASSGIGVALMLIGAAIWVLDVVA
jgi:hypothetical protein